MGISFEELRDFLDEKVVLYNTAGFIEHDPVQIPHMYEAKEDIEVAGFLIATISWGRRLSIIHSGKKMMRLLGNSPYDFIMNHREEHLEKLCGFVHRTFNSTDFIYFLKAIRFLYREKGGLEGVFSRHQTPDSLQPAIHHFKREFFSLSFPQRTAKHLPDPYQGSAAKRMNMYLRWMVRKDKGGVDFGIWDQVPASILSCPLDIHTGNVARKLGLISRRQNDAKAVFELDEKLRELDPIDPVKYDFALFGLGSVEKF